MTLKREKSCLLHWNLGMMLHEEKRREEEKEKSVERRAVLELFIAFPSDLLKGLEAI